MIRKTPRELVHATMVGADKAGAFNVPACAFGGAAESMLCDRLTAAIEADRRDSEEERDSLTSQLAEARAEVERQRAEAERLHRELRAAWNLCCLHAVPAKLAAKGGSWECPAHNHLLP